MGLREHILIIEDDEDIQQLVSFNLLKAGYQVSCAESAEEGRRFLDKEEIDGLVLDIMLPDEDGVSFCRALRGGGGRLAALPVLMLTAKAGEEEVIAGLEAGADDYITKPFSPKVLVARVKAVLRRRRPGSDDDGIISIRGVSIDPARHEVLVNGHAVSLTSTEFSILHLIASRPGRVFSRRQLIDAVRGHEYIVTHRVIDVQIFSLRRKLGAEGKSIETVRGVGYRYKE